jgi:hypothetical protein
MQILIITDVDCMWWHDVAVPLYIILRLFTSELTIVNPQVGHVIRKDSPDSLTCAYISKRKIGLLCDVLKVMCYGL